MSKQPILAVNIGNSRTQFARFEGAQRAEDGSLSLLPNEPRQALVDALLAELAILRDSGEDPVLVACSVNPPVADAVEAEISARAPDAEFLLARRDVPLTINHSLDDSGERTVGQDRLCDAIGAFAMLGQACVVVDAGSAVTVDFVDGEGVFHGGAIAPGARMMLRAMHEKTAALPALEFAAPEGVGGEAGELQPFGRNTPQAMLNGVFFALRGLVRQLAERYAEKYEAYPVIIATGGDAGVLFSGDELVERVIPDLTLRGVAHAFDAWMRTLGESNTDEAEDGAGPTGARDITP